MKKIELDKSKILSQIKNLDSLAKKNSWKFEYDQDLDEFTFGLKRMPRDSFLFNVNDELNLFLSPDSTVNGIFIEYFATNFLEHNKELEPVLEVIEELEVGEDVSENQDATKALELELVADTFKSIIARDKLVTAI